jgi:hypothetical protein
VVTVTPAIPECVRKDNQVVANAGLFFVCHKLSKMRWNALPTSRNAAGIDIIAYKGDATALVQVKALSKRAPVPLGKSAENRFANFFVICTHAMSGEPVCYVLKRAEVDNLACRREKDGKVSYWLQPKAYDTPEFREEWSRIEGT